MERFNELLAGVIIIVVSLMGLKCILNYHKNPGRAIGQLIVTVIVGSLGYSLIIGGSKDIVDIFLGFADMIFGA
ncbi:MAG: hypothetical protein ABFC94_13530 [Syntrophomonas sp.]